LSYATSTATLVVDAVLGVVVADAFDRFARDLLKIDRGPGGDLAGHDHQAGVNQGLGGHTGEFVLG
jgi:hypothetical protein